MKINPVNNYNIQTEPEKDSNNNKKKEAKPDFKDTDLGVLNDYKKDLISFRGDQEVDSTSNPLDRFTVPQYIRTMPHNMYFYINKATSSILTKLKVSDCDWKQTPMKSETLIPWKMHVFADTEEDWVKLVTCVGRYLNTQPVTWKTVSAFNPIDKLNECENQKGKAFTIYPANEEQFKQLAHDIDYIVRLNHLEQEDSAVIGDRKLGDTGRIFYRYEHKSGETKDKIYHCDNEDEMEECKNNYDPNRGTDQYLAADMTTEDDPFYTFNPQEPVV